MIRLKLKLSEYILIAIFSIPIGVFLYYHNINKATFRADFSGGYAITNNFCENLIRFEKNQLNTGYDLKLIEEKYKKNKIRISINGENVYTIEIKSDINNEINIKEIYNNIILYIKDSEKNNFNRLYKNVQLNCKSKIINLFKEIPVKDDLMLEVKLRYKRIHLIILLFTPSILLYLLLITYKYIIEVGCNKNAKKV